MNRFAVLLAVLHAAAAAPALGQSAVGMRPQLPFERPAPCAEYCEPDWAACRTVTLYDAPQPGARPASRVARGARLTVVDGLMRTKRVGIVVFRRPMRYAATRVTEDARGRELGIDSAERRFEPRDTVFVIDRVGNGDGEPEFRWFFRGVHERGLPFWAEWPEESEPPALMVRKPEQEWWVQLRTPSGGAGWARFERDDWAGVTPKYDDPPENCAK